jgi:5-methylcytosine-specific restriction endonuclease McrA
MIGQATHDKLSYVQELLSHQVPLGDVAEVLDRALDLLIRQLEKAKFAATHKPRTSQRRPGEGSRHIPADVKRAVWQRDGGRCTFVSEAGKRCPARALLEFDHIDPVARGGLATVARMRLRCRAHNQYGAECTFGTEFMNRKRWEARAAAKARSDSGVKTPPR